MDRLEVFESSFLRLMAKFKNKVFVFGLADFISWRRRHMRMALQRELQLGFRHMCESCLIRVFGYASTSVWGPSNHHVPALRAALARRSAAWLNTLQEAGAHVAPTRRKVRVECDAYWRH